MVSVSTTIPTWRAYASIVALVDDQKFSRADLQMAADMDGSARDVVERLMALQVFDTHSDSSYSVSRDYCLPGRRR